MGQSRSAIRPSVLRQFSTVLAALRDAQLNQAWDRVPVLDGQLRELLATSDLARSVEDPAARQELIETLKSIDRVHRDLRQAAVEQRRVIADTLQQLRHDQRAANAYDHVRRQSF